MGRRRRVNEDDYSSDEGGSDEEENWDQDDDGPEFKRRKKNRGGGKEDAIYGIFADEDDANGRRGGIGRTVRGTDNKGRKVDYLRGQAFVPASSNTRKQNETSEMDVDMEKTVRDDSSGESDDSDDSGGDFDEKEAEKLSKAPIREEDAWETRPAFGGIGFGGPTALAKEAERETSGLGFQPASFVSSRGGIGSKGLSFAPASISTGVEQGSNGSAALGSQNGVPSTSSSGLPSAFGAPAAQSGSASTSRPKPSFLNGGGKKQSANMIQRGTNIKFGGGLGGGFNPAEALAKMGWSGGGLGKQGEGIVNPIDVQLRPERAGIAYGGRKEMTKQNREEAKRRGQKFSDEEDEEITKKGKGKKADTGPPAWTRSEKKPTKPKLEYKTYEQIIEEAEGTPVTAAGIGQIIDATGREMREVSSIHAAIGLSHIPTKDSTHLPELRHNLKILCEQNERDLGGLGREGAELRDRLKWSRREREENERKLLKEEEEAAHMQGVLEIAQDIESLGLKAQTDSSMTLSAFEPLVQRLQADFSRDILAFNLDEALIGALVPIVRRTVASWQPLKEPSLMAREFRKWTKAFRLEENQIIAQSRKGKAAMSPYESLIWQLVMPKLRSTLNNDWDPVHPTAAVALIEAWSPALPRFIKDNIMDQLLLPRLKRALSEWDTRRGTSSLRHLVFPWLPVFPERSEDLLSEAKRKFRSALKAWRPSKDMPSDTGKWREIFTANEWESIMLDVIVPKLGSALRADFTVDPSNQDMAPLERVLQWAPMLRDSVMSRILEKEFFTRWLEVLHMWLVQPSANFNEVAQWYTFWKGWFPENIVALPGLQQGFTRGLDLINKAVELGDKREQLAKPVTDPMSRSIFKAAQSVTTAPASGRGVAPEDISFRSLVEEAASEADLIVQALNRTDPTTGSAILRVSKGIDGKKGINFFIQEDVLWAAEKQPDSSQIRFAPVSMQELFDRAKG